MTHTVRITLADSRKVAEVSISSAASMVADGYATYTKAPASQPDESAAAKPGSARGAGSAAKPRKRTPTKKTTTSASDQAADSVTDAPTGADVVSDAGEVSDQV